jgi:TatD DNase family protein
LETLKSGWLEIKFKDLEMVMTGTECGIVDTHAHICDPVFDPDRAEVLARAKAAGVAAVIAVSEDINDAKKNIELALKHPILRPAAGLYPTHLHMEKAREMVAFIREHRERLIAIGEVGLDYWVVKQASDREIQREIFKLFIDLALQVDLPLNVHSRSAGRHAVSLLLERNAQRVQFHAFDGKASAAMPAVDAGCFFSIPPSIVRSRQKQKLVKQLPLSCLLVETDSPVLGPVPGERNEPANVISVIDAIAEIKGLRWEKLSIG